MANSEMAEFWNTRGGDQWVNEQARYDAMLEPCGRRLLDAADLQSGERVLDVGCGSGASSLESARRVGPEGLVVGVDLSGPMIETARRRASEFGVACSFVQGDAQTMSFDGTFDAVISRFGVMFFDDPAAAFCQPGERAAAGRSVVLRVLAAAVRQRMDQRAGHCRGKPRRSTGATS